MWKSLEEDVMTTQALQIHRSWEDWGSMALGALILFSPIVAQTIDMPYVTLNAMLVGSLVILLGWQELVLLEAWEEYLELALGVWLLASPWLFGYSDLVLPTFAHAVLGGLIAVLAALELWQDQTRHAT
jgi:hypothetical protein